MSEAPHEIRFKWYGYADRPRDVELKIDGVTYRLAETGWVINRSFDEGRDMSVNYTIVSSDPLPRSVS